eukprot:g25911.t1
MKNLHRMSLQLVGGKSSSKIYQIFFHTVDPTYQVHINVPDHRQPIFPTNEVFHQWHPLMAGLRKRPRLRFLIRLKPMDSGPLDAMCGCCGGSQAIRRGSCLHHLARRSGNVAE